LKVYSKNNINEMVCFTWSRQDINECPQMNKLLVHLFWLQCMPYSLCLYITQFLSYDFFFLWKLTMWFFFVMNLWMPNMVFTILNVLKKIIVFLELDLNISCMIFFSHAQSPYYYFKHYSYLQQKLKIQINISCPNSMQT